MAKRNHDEDKFIKINPLTNSTESLISVALLNALIILKAEENPNVKIPSRKELTKLLKNAKFDNVCKVLEELNGIKIRPVVNMESTGEAGIIQMNHPVKPVYCTIRRGEGITGEFEIQLINSGLGDDIVTLREERFLECLNFSDVTHYQIMLDTGKKEIFKDEHCSCENCCRYFIDNNRDDVCLYDDESISDTDICCNKYLDCFKWRKPKGE